MYLLFEVFINDSVMCVLRPDVHVIELSQQKQLFLAAPTLLESHKKLRMSHPIKLISLQTAKLQMSLYRSYQKPVPFVGPISLARLYFYYCHTI